MTHTNQKVFSKEIAIRPLRKVKISKPIYDSFFVTIDPWELLKKEFNQYDTLEITSSLFGLDSIDRYEYVWTINGNTINQGDEKSKLNFVFDKVGTHKVELTVRNKKGFSQRDSIFLHVKSAPRPVFKKEIIGDRSPIEVIYSLDEDILTNREIKEIRWKIEGAFFLHQGNEFRAILDKPGKHKIKIWYISGEGEISREYFDEIVVPESDYYFNISLNNWDYINESYKNHIYYGEESSISFNLISKNGKLACDEVQYNLETSSDLFYKLDTKECELIISYNNKINKQDHVFTIRAIYSNRAFERKIYYKTFPLVSSVKITKDKGQDRTSLQRTNTSLDGTYLNFGTHDLEKKHEVSFDIYELDKMGNYRLNLRESTADVFDFSPNDKYRFIKKIKFDINRGLDDFDGLLSCRKNNCRFDSLLK